MENKKVWSEKQDKEWNILLKKEKHIYNITDKITVKNLKTGKYENIDRHNLACQEGYSFDKKTVKILIIPF